MTVAVVVNELQRGSVGDLAVWPALRDAAAPILPRVAELIAAAHEADVPVVHILSAKRADMRGSNDNAPLFRAARRSGGLRYGTPAVELVDDVAATPSDLIVWKFAGHSPFPVTDLDPILRHLGADTLVVCGISMNVAIPSIVFDAVNRGYRIVVPRDCVAGVPPKYAAQVLDHTLSLLADVTTADAIVF